MELDKLTPRPLKNPNHFLEFYTDEADIVIRAFKYSQNCSLCQKEWSNA